MEEAEVRKGGVASKDLAVVDLVNTGFFREFSFGGGNGGPGNFRELRSSSDGTSRRSHGGGDNSFSSLLGVVQDLSPSATPPPGLVITLLGACHEDSGVYAGY